MVGERNKKAKAAGDAVEEQRSAIRLLMATLLSFATALTMVNAPYLFLGYGLGALGVFTAGFILKPTHAVATFLLGHSAGIVLVRFTEGIFTLVAVAAIIVRTVGVYIVSRLKAKIGILSAAFVGLVYATLIATFLGALVFGEGGLSAALAIFDTIYILPSYLIAKALSDASLSPQARRMLPVTVLIAVFALFVTAVPFFNPAGSALAAAALTLASLASFYQQKLASKRALTIIVAVAVIAAPVSFLTSASSFSYNLRTTLYPLYPDSLARSQWIQKEIAPDCRQGDLAGGRREEQGVWGPERLRVIDTCVVVTGTVRDILPQLGLGTDRDFNIDLEVDPQYRELLALGNIMLRGGALHIEVVPSDQPALRDILTALRPGDRVTVVGAFVVDTDHGHWSEVHPAWIVRRA